MKNKHLKFIIGSIASLILIVFVYLLYRAFNDILNLKAMDTKTPKETEEILSRTINTPIYLFQYIGTTLMLIVTTTIAAWMLSKKVKGIDKAFAISLLFFGGLGVPFILYIVKLFKERKGSPKTALRKNVIFTRTTGIATASVLAIVPIALIAYSATMKGIDEPTHAPAPVFASDASYATTSQKKNTTPNLVEIFTDGFDERAMNDLLDPNKHIDPKTKGTNNPKNINTEKLEGFVGLPNFLTPGFITNDSIPAMFSNNYADVNPFMAHLEVQQKKYQDTVLNYEYKEWFPQFAMGRMNGGALYKSDAVPMNVWDGPKTNTKINKHFVNPTSMSDSTSYMPHVSGNPDYVSHKYDAKTSNKVKIVNWGQAKNEVAGNFGTSNLSSDGQFYNWVNQKSVSSDAADPEYLFMQDSVTHTPKNGGKGNALKWDETFNKYQKVIDNVNAIVQHLKDINAYDNTMIVFYGDHADHSRTTLVDNGADTMVRGNRSFALVKYPNANHPFKMDYDNAYEATEYNDIIIDGMNGGNESFLQSSKFSISREFRIYDGSNKTAVTHLVKHKDTQTNTGTYEYSRDNKGIYEYPYDEIIDQRDNKKWNTYNDLKKMYTSNGNTDYNALRSTIENLADPTKAVFK